MKSLVILIALGFSGALFANGPTLVCMKEGKNVEVNGDTVEKKKAACEAEKGQWVEEKPKQSAGKGAGW